MKKSKKFIVPVGESVQKAYDALVEDQNKAFNNWSEMSDRANGYLKSLFPKGYKSDGGYSSYLGRHTDSLVNGYLILSGTIETEE